MAGRRQGLDARALERCRLCKPVMAGGWPTANGWANGGDFWQDLEGRRAGKTFGLENGIGLARPIRGGNSRPVFFARD